MEYEYQNFDDTISFANSLGFDDEVVEIDLLKENGDEYTPSIADALEEAAIDYIRTAGYKVTGYND